MWDLAATIIFTLFGAILSLEAFLRLRDTRHVLFFVAGILAAMAALAIPFSLEWGLAAVIPAIMVRLIAKIASSHSAGPDDEEKPPP